jgi:hypothetical protein
MQPFAALCINDRVADKPIVLSVAGYRTYDTDNSAIRLIRNVAFRHIYGGSALCLKYVGATLSLPEGESQGRPKNGGRRRNWRGQNVNERTMA